MWRQVRRQFGAMTDSKGQYSVRVGPGTYTLMGPPRTSDEKITVSDQAELVRDFRMPRPEKGTLTGRVVHAGNEGTGVAGARLRSLPKVQSVCQSASQQTPTDDSRPNENSTLWSSSRPRLIERWGHWSRLAPRSRKLSFRSPPWRPLRAFSSTKRSVPSRTRRFIGAGASISTKNRN